MTFEVLQVGAWALAAAAWGKVALLFAFAFLLYRLARRL